VGCAGAAPVGAVAPAPGPPAADIARDLLDASCPVTYARCSAYSPSLDASQRRSTLRASLSWPKP